MEECDERQNAQPREMGSTKWGIIFDDKKGQERKKEGREREG